MGGEEEQEYIKKVVKNEFEWNESEIEETIWVCLDCLEKR